jgi:hypothetical protein
VKREVGSLGEVMNEAKKEVSKLKKQVESIGSWRAEIESNVVGLKPFVESKSVGGFEL